MIRDRVRELMKFLDITQKDFAMSIGSNQSTISKYLSGQRKPTKAICNSMIREYELNADWLLYDEGPMFKEDLQREKVFLISKVKHMSEKEVRLFSDFIQYVYRTDEKFQKLESDDK